MKDGTVEYMLLWRAFKDNSLKYYGKINRVTDIIKIDIGKTEGEYGEISPIAIKSDSSYYYLYTMLKDSVIVFWNLIM